MQVVKPRLLVARAPCFSREVLCCVREPLPLTVSRQIVLNMAATGNEEQTLLPDIEEEAEGMEREMESEEEEEEGMGVEHSEEEDEEDTSEDERENEAEIQRLEEQVRGMNEANDSPHIRSSQNTARSTLLGSFCSCIWQSPFIREAVRA